MGIVYENLDIVELFQLKCLKHILNLKICTPYKVYGETGRFSLGVSVNFYSRVVHTGQNFSPGKKNKIVQTLYKYLIVLIVCILFWVTVDFYIWNDNVL